MAQPARILVVDDEPAILLTYTAILQQNGYTVTGVDSVEEAKKALRANAFEVLLCDLTLAGRSGLEVVEFAREQSPGIEALLLTGFADPETAIEAAGKRVVLMYKPLEVAHLLRTIELLAAKRG